MKIFLCVITDGNEIASHFAKKVAVVPADILKRGFFADRLPTVQVNVFKPHSRSTQADFESFLLSRIDDASACIVLSDRRFLSLVRDVRSGSFTCLFDPPTNGLHLGNHFSAALAKIFRALGVILNRFSDHADAKLMALPLRNFHAAEIGNLQSIVSNALTASDLAKEIDTQLKGLRRRIRPRSKSSFPTLYAVDERGRFFIFGKEKHSRYATGTPHRPSCSVNAKFRFGCSIDEIHHYNVSEGEHDRTLISGKFVDCHDVEHKVDSKSHLDMFSNDYFSK